MFRVTFFVEDNKLSKVLHAVQGMVLNMEPPQPVVNATVEKGVVKAETNASSYKDMFLKYVEKLPKDTVFTSKNIKQHLTQLGASASAYNHYVKAMKEAKLAKPRSRGHFVRV